MKYYETTATKKIASLRKKIRAVQGGTSASKTISILLYLIALNQADKQRKLTSVISESTPHLKRGAIRDFKNIMMDHHYWQSSRWNATDSIYTFETGSQMEFFGADQSEKLRGARRDRGFINEANNISLQAFDEFEVRTRDLLYMDWNPTNEFYFYTDIQPLRTDVDHIILTYLDNEALEQATVDSIEQRKNRKGWWQVYGLGQLGEVEGKIYKDWQIIDEIPHEAKLVRFAIDFGFTNDPTAIVAIYYYNGGYIVDELAFSKGLKTKEIADIILNQERDDVLVVADSAEPRTIAEIKDHGVRNIVPVVKKGESKSKTWVTYKIEKVQEERISMTSRSVNVIHEYRNYLWEVDKDGRILNVPEHEFSHSMNAVEYGISSIRKGDGPKKARIYKPKHTGFNRSVHNKHIVQR